MARVNVYDRYDGTLVGWFNDDAAETFGEYREWDGSNMISRATGSQWRHEELYRTAGGRWVLHRWSNVQGEREHYEFITEDEAREWLLAQGHDEAVERYFGAIEEERGPGRPEIGPRLQVRVPQEIIDGLDKLADIEGVPRADVVRRLLADALAFARVRVSADEEYNAEEWWFAARADGNPPACIAEWIQRMNFTPLYLTPEQAEEVRKWAEGLPGWADGPAHAPHPLIFQE